MLLKQSTALTLFAFILTLACAALPGCAAQEISAANQTTIVLPADPIPAEQTAAKELQNYLSKITGSDCQIIAENAATPIQGTAIYLGPTQFAKANLNDANTFADEEWTMQTVGNALVLTGGRPRGTLYAAYHFLEDVCGVHWWTPWEESVPTRKAISIANLNRREKPSFGYRDIYELYATNDGGRFMARSRLNRQGDKPVGPVYAGTRDYGPPAHAQTVNDSIYIDPKKYYPAHPDWFVVKGGVEAPTLGNSQPAFSNPEMRQEFLRLLLINIRESRAAAIAKNAPVPLVYGISQNDNMVSLVIGPADEALVKENGGAESAIVLSFINYLADGIREEFPDVSIDTLAYLNRQAPPTNMTVRDNVIIRFCDTQNYVLRPITDDLNRATRLHLENWSKICKNLRVWDYNTTYKFLHLPKPTMQTYPKDLQFYLQQNVQGVFVEYEYPIDADMRDMKIWMLGKLLENPHQDYNALVNKFTDGYYGAAGPFVRQYLTALEAAAAKSTKFLHWFADLEMYDYLTTDFLERADGIYADAANAVQDDPLLSRRVATARASVDIAMLQRYPILIKDWQQAGNPEDAFPLDRTAAGQRYLQAMDAQIDLWIRKAEQPGQREKAQKTVDDLISPKAPPAAPAP